MRSAFRLRPAEREAARCRARLPLAAVGVAPRLGFESPALRRRRERPLASAARRRTIWTSSGSRARVRYPAAAHGPPPRRAVAVLGALSGAWRVLNPQPPGVRSPSALKSIAGVACCEDTVSPHDASALADPIPDPHQSDSGRSILAGSCPTTLRPARDARSRSASRSRTSSRPSRRCTSRSACSRPTPMGRSVSSTRAS